MSIHPESAHQIVQKVHEKLDSSPKFLDLKTIALARKALDDLSKINSTNPEDQLALISLASRISVLSQSDKITEKTGWISRFWGTLDSFLGNDAISIENEELKYSLAQDFLSKASLTSSLAQKIDNVLSKYPDLRDEILHEMSAFIKKDMNGEELISTFEKIRDEKITSLSYRILKARDNEIPSELRKLRSTNSKTLVAILKVAAAIGGKYLSYVIKNYDIINQQDLIEIAKIAAAQSGEGISSFIQNFDIKEEKARIEIAKIAAAGAGYEVCLYIHNYGITSQQELIEIAKIAALDDGNGIFMFLKNFNIKDAKALKEIVKIGFHNNAFYGLSHLKTLCPNLSSKEYTDLILYGLVSVFAFAEEASINRIYTYPELLPFLKRDSISEESTPPFSSFLQINAESILPKDLWRDTERKTVLKKIEAYGNRSIAGDLSLVLLEYGQIAEFKKIYLLFSSGKTKTKPADTSLMPHKLLPAIVVAKWILETNKTNSLAPAKILNDLVAFLNDSRDAFKADSSRLLQPFLLTELVLDKTESIPPLDKLKLLSSVCTSTEPIKGLVLIQSLCGRNEIDSLKKIPLNNPIEELTLLFEESLIKDQFINLSGIENLTDKYLKTFVNTRIPLALETYMTNLRSLGNIFVKKALESLVRSILTGTFEKDRYDTSLNIHLKQIQKYDHENKTTILENWKTLGFEAPVNPISETSEEDLFSFEAFFKTKLIIDKHGHNKDGIDQLADLSNFLEGSLEVRSEITEGLRQKIKNSEERLESELTREEKKELGLILKLDRAQKLSIELLTEPFLSKEEQAAKIQKITSFLSSLELVNDLKGLAQTLRSSQKSSSLEKVKLCKGWEDLFLSGSEIAGSCQRIDGYAKHNKCLIAYCLDGKNSMIAVKDPDEKILARSILRLLWDKTNSKPVLFLERLYPNPCPKERKNAILSGASICAKELGLEIFTSWDLGLSSDGNLIESLGSSSPYEYSDGAGGVMDNGLFAIRNAQKIPLI